MPHHPRNTSTGTCLIDGGGEVAKPRDTLHTEVARDALRCVRKQVGGLRPHQLYYRTPRNTPEERDRLAPPTCYHDIKGRRAPAAPSSHMRRRAPAASSTRTIHGLLPHRWVGRRALATPTLPRGTAGSCHTIPCIIISDGPCLHLLIITQATGGGSEPRDALRPKAARDALRCVRT